MGWTIQSIACGAQHFAVSASYQDEHSTITWCARNSAPDIKTLLSYSCFRILSISGSDRRTAPQFTTPNRCHASCCINS